MTMIIMIRANDNQISSVIGFNQTGAVSQWPQWQDWLWEWISELDKFRLIALNKKYCYKIQK